jgi:hypothetical protein
MSYGDFTVSKPIDFQAIYIKRLWDSSDRECNSEVHTSEAASATI